MSKARQSKRQRYRKPRADYQAGGRVNARTGGRRPARVTDDRARGGRKIPNRKNTTMSKPTQTLVERSLKNETAPFIYEAKGTPAQIKQFEQNQAPDTTTNQPIIYRTPDTPANQPMIYRAKPISAKLPENVIENPASLTTTRRPGRLPRRDEPDDNNESNTRSFFKQNRIPKEYKKTKFLDLEKKYLKSKFLNKIKKIIKIKGS